MNVTDVTILRQVHFRSLRHCRAKLVPSLSVRKLKARRNANRDFPEMRETGYRNAANRLGSCDRRCRRRESHRQVLYPRDGKAMQRAATSRYGARTRSGRDRSIRGDAHLALSPGGEVENDNRDSLPTHDAAILAQSRLIAEMLPIGSRSRTPAASR